VTRVVPLTNLTLIHANGWETKVKGWFFPKGTQVGLLNSAINRDPKRFEDPNSFKPERFLDENGKFVFNDKVTSRILFNKLAFC